MNHLRKVLVTATIIIGVTAAAASAMQFAQWSTAQKIDEVGGNSSELNTPSTDGCPIQSPDGLSLYTASNRPGAPIGFQRASVSPCDGCMRTAGQRQRRT